jgi:hypothetical protein
LATATNPGGRSYSVSTMRLGDGAFAPAEPARNRTPEIVPMHVTRRRVPGAVLPVPTITQSSHRGANSGSRRRGWRADWAGGRDGAETRLVVLCAECWEREFGAS